MRIVFTYTLLLSICLACEAPKKATDEAPSEGSEELNYSYKVQNIAEEIPGCTGRECTEVVLNFPVFEKGPVPHEKINAHINRELKKLLSDFIMEAGGNEPLDQLIDMFFSSYQSFKESFPESKAPWYVKIDVVVSHTAKDFVSLSFNTSSYTGGAQPNTFIEYVNINQNGKPITSLDYFFNDPEKLEGLAEKQFRSRYQLDPGQSLAAKGFIFENDSFTLTDNFGFSQSGVVFYYNSSEIAPNSTGPTALVIPYYELQSDLKDTDLP